MVKAKMFIFEKPFQGVPNETNFKLIEEILPPLRDGEFVAEAHFLSVDPYMRGFASKEDIGKPLFGEQVAKIIESKNDKYPVGEFVVGSFGWRTHTIGTEKNGKFGFPAPRLVPDIGNLPKSLMLGVLGMPGHTAYFGIYDFCKVKPGETVVISAAGGAVGSHAGQIAKIEGCRVVGITGSEEKGKWLLEELGFDAYVNYKNPNFAAALAEATPKGIDCYFDNVGGEISAEVIYKMNKFGRIAVCGSISTYNCYPNNLPKVKEIQTPVKINHLKMAGLSVLSLTERWNESLDKNLQWVTDGKLKYKETLTEGFENMVTAFTNLFYGKNIGKAIVKV